jgi:rubrerythrin
MRKSLFLLVILTVSAYAGSPLSVQRVLTNAVNGERLAAARYDAFAERAEADGYAGIAALFRAEARAEKIHIGRFVMLMDERGMPVPPDVPAKVEVESTDRNLQTSIASEQAERDSTYLYAVNVCNEAREEQVAKIFDVTRDAETEHANLCAGALRKLDSYKVAKAFYLCPVCGYTTDVRLSKCPSCARPGTLDRIE